MEDWAEAWFERVRHAYVNAYLAEAHGSQLVPSKKAVFEQLLEAYELEKAIYELGYEINNRPNWVVLPLTSLTQYVERR